MPKRRLTIKDVAAQAEVSIATVSNVLHGKSTLYTPETAEKVWEAIRALGYRPNRLARSLVRKRTHTLGIVTERHHAMLTRNVYFSHVLDGFLEYSLSHDYQIKLITLTKDDLYHVLSLVEDGMVDGAALVAPVIEGVLLKWAQQTSLPVVVIGSTPPLETGLNYVDVDNFQAMYEATCWLIEQGHQRIGFISGPEFQWSARIRERAFRQALQDRGLNFGPNWHYQGAYTIESGRQGVQSLLQVQPALTAIVCSNDWMAMGALEELRTQGVSVPEQMSILGFDDIETAPFTQPPLTTVRQPMHEIGARAAELLIRWLEEGSQEPVRILFQGKLIERASVMSPPSTATLAAHPKNW